MLYSVRDREIFKRDRRRRRHIMLSLMEAGDVSRVAKRREGWEEVLSRRLALFVVVSRLL